MKLMNRIIRTLLVLSFLICISCNQKSPYRIPKYPEIEQDIYFEGDYPPVVQVTYEEDGQTYLVDAVQGQVVVMFEETISHESAFEILKNNHAKIVVQLPKVHYYLVEVPVGKEGEFICCMRKIPEVDFVYPNAIEAACSVVPCVIDNFQKKEQEDSHGNMVAAMMENSDGFLKTQKFDVALVDNMVNTDKVFVYLDLILRNLESDDGVVINLSFTPSLIKFWSIIKPWQHRVLWNDRFVTDDNRLSYKRKYINGLKNLIKFTKQYDAKDFVIVKSSGNEGMKELEIIVEQLRSELSPKERNVFDRHFILVSAKDNNKEGDYPNDVSLGHYDKMITKVDISDMTAQNLDWQGTSFSSPRAAGFIVNAAEKYDKKVVDVLAYARLATMYHSEHLLTMEGLSELIVKKNPFEGHEDEWYDNTSVGIESGFEGGIPSSLVGTKWSKEDIFGNRNTIEFINNHQGILTEHDGVFGFEPNKSTFEYCYNSKENSFFSEADGNVWLKYEKGRLFVTNLFGIQIEYERIK